MLSLGFSPCPNDTFLFDALVNGKLDTEGLEFEVLLADVEELNQKAFAGELDITKLSYHAYAHLIDDYQLLNAGSALGNNCGPLLIARQPMTPEAINTARIAIPGQYTTANFLLSLAYPQAQNRQALLFSDIEGAVLSGEVDAGLIIHENRFTYEDKGLVKIRDLGEFWEETMALPIPLGGIAIKRSLPEAVKQQVDRLLRQSVSYALAQPAQTMDYVSRYAQEMDPKVMQQHIELYVNDFSVDLGQKGRFAVKEMYRLAQQKGILAPYEQPLFVHQLRPH
ncbi:MAG: 1,4-dihydroxy-6-naphthoate synthase [Bacteroidota bacterium]